MAGKTIKIIFAVSLITYLFLLFIKPKLPGSSKIRQEIIINFPLQEVVDQTQINTSYGDFTYTLTPLYSYDIYGLVVSEYKSRNWLDITHKRDPANTRDLCLVWGQNVKSDVYQKVKYSHGEFTCYYYYNQALDPPFNGRELSNNHLIPQNSDIEKKIAGVNIGDQVRIKGFLVNYKITDKDGRESASRNTSTSREDTRNGACEIIYVSDIEILKSGNTFYYLLKNILPFIIILTAIYFTVKFLFF